MHINYILKQIEKGVLSPEDFNYCPMCDTMQPIKTFFKPSGVVSRYCVSCRSNSSKTYKERQKERASKWRTANPLKVQKTISKGRGMGFTPLTNYFKGAEVHHLHIEGSTDHAVYLPYWVHRFNRHCVKTWVGMDTINAQALDYWINEEMYQSLYELTPTPMNPDDSLEEEEEIDLDNFEAVDAIPWEELHNWPKIEEEEIEICGKPIVKGVPWDE